VALVGRSGTGKTTLLKLAAGLLQPSSGSVRLSDREQGSDRGTSRAVALALEYPERQLFGRTVGEDVAALLWVQGMHEPERRARARVAMESVGLDPVLFEDRSPVTLSEGEKRRAALAGLLVDPPRAVLLDEPTAGLDLAGRLALAKALANVCARGHAVLLASHDLEFVANVANRVAVVGREEETSGTILAVGVSRDILGDAPLMARAGLPIPSLRNEARSSLVQTEMQFPSIRASSGRALSGA
jgi:energy-coupling factor transport system ATP-binding protein